MKLSILGIFVGAGISIGAFIKHDINYRGGRDFEVASINPGNYAYGDNSYIEDYHGADARENTAYVIGTAGTIILTISAKHLWNQHKTKSTTKRNQPYGKFRIALDLITSASLWVAGVNLADAEWEKDGLRYVRQDNDEWKAYPIGSDRDEHLGYLLGTVSTAWFTLSAKHAWDQRRRPPKPPTMSALMKDRQAWSRALRHANGL